MIKIFRTNKSKDLPEQLKACKNPVYLILDKEQDPILLDPTSQQYAMFKEFWNTGHLSEIGLKVSKEDMIPLVKMME